MAQKRIHELTEELDVTSASFSAMQLAIDTVSASEALKIPASALVVDFLETQEDLIFSSSLLLQTTGSLSVTSDKFFIGGSVAEVHILGGSSQISASAHPDADDLVITGSARTGITIQSSSANAFQVGQGWLAFGDDHTSSCRGAIYYDHFSDWLFLRSRDRNILLLQDNLLEFQDDMDMTTLGGGRFRIRSSSTIFRDASGDDVFHIGPGEIVVNESGLDVDFRVEGDTDTNLLLVNAGQDSVGIGTNPTSGSFKLFSRLIADDHTSGEAAGILGQYWSRVTADAPNPVLAGIYGATYADSGSSNTGTLAGTRGYVDDRPTFTGTATAFWGGYFKAQQSNGSGVVSDGGGVFLEYNNLGGSTTDAYGALVNIITTTGNILRGFGIDISSPTVTTGSITNYHGIRIQDITSVVTNAIGIEIANVTGATNNYSIYTGAGSVSFGDNLHFRQSASISTTSGDLTLESAGDIDLMGLIAINSTCVNILPNTLIGSLTNPPKGILHVQRADTGVAASDLTTLGDEFIIEAANFAGMTILTASAQNSSIVFGYDGATSHHRIDAYGPGHATEPSELHFLVSNSVQLHWSPGTFQFRPATQITTASGALTLATASGPINIQPIGDVVINESGLDVDFRVEGDGESNLIVTDAASDVVAVGATPTSTVRLFAQIQDAGLNSINSAISGDYVANTGATPGTHAGGNFRALAQQASEATEAWAVLANGTYQSSASWATIGAIRAQVSTATSTCSVGTTALFYGSSWNNLGTGFATQTFGVRLPSYSSTGTTTNQYGYYLGGQTSGNIVNKYGMWMGNISGATGSNFALFTSSGSISFGDDVIFRQAARISTTSGCLTFKSDGDVYVFDLSDNAGLATTTGSRYMRLTGASLMDEGARLTLFGDTYVGGSAFSELHTDRFRISNAEATQNGIADFRPDEIVFNEPGVDTDFRVEGDTNQNLLFVDAGLDGVAIGTTPQPSNLFRTLKQDSSSTSFTTNRFESTYTPSASGSFTKRGAYFVATTTGSFGTTSQVNTLRADAISQTASPGSIGNLIAIIARAYADGASAGNVPNARLFYSDFWGNNSTNSLVTNAFGFSLPSTTAIGPISNLYAFHLATQTASTIADRYGFRVDGLQNGDNNYGVYLGDITGGSTADYAIYTNAGSVSFGDNIIFRQSASITSSSGNLTISPTDNTIVLSPTPNSERYLRLTHSVGSHDFNIWSDSTSGCDSYISFQDGGDIVFYRDTVTSTNEKLRIGDTEIVVNEGGQDTNFRVEGDTNKNMIVVDAGMDAIGIGTTPLSVNFLRTNYSDGASDSFTVHAFNSSIQPAASGNYSKIGAQFTTTYFGTEKNTGNMQGLHVAAVSQVASPATVSAIYGIVTRTYIAGASAGNVTSMRLYYSDFFGNNSANAGISNLYGYSLPGVTSTGSIQTVYGFHMPVVNASNIATRYGMRIDTLQNGNNNYGIYLGDMTGGSAVNYAIRTGAGSVSFGDNLHFRQSASITTTTGDLSIAPAGDLILEPVGGDLDLLGLITINSACVNILPNTVIGDLTSSSQFTALVVKAASVSSVPSLASGVDDFIIEQSSNAGMAILTERDQVATLGFAYPTVGARHQITAYGDQHPSIPDQVRIRVAAGDRVSFRSGCVSFTQDVIIGGLISDSPSATLHVRESAVTGGSVTVAGDTLIVENDGDAGMTILGTNDTVLYFGDPEGAAVGGVWYQHSTDRLFLRVNNSNDFILSTACAGIEPNTTIGSLTASPKGTLYIQSGDASASPSTDADDLVVEAGGTGGISVLTPAANVGYLYFGSDTSTSRAGLAYSHNIDELRLFVNDDIRLRVSDSGGDWFFDQNTNLEVTSSCLVLSSACDIVFYAGAGSLINQERLRIQDDLVIVNQRGQDVDFAVEDSSNNRLFQVDAGERSVAVGVNIQAGSSTQFYNFKNETGSAAYSLANTTLFLSQTASTNQPKRAGFFSVLGLGPDGTTGGVSGITVYAENRSPLRNDSLVSFATRTFTSGNSGSMRAIAIFSSGIFRNTGSGSVASAWGFNVSSYTSTPCPTFEWMGFKVDAQSETNIDNKYAFYANNITGASSGNYAIFTNSGSVSFGDNMEFRQAASISNTSGDLTIESDAGDVIIQPVVDTFVGIGHTNPLYALDVRNMGDSGANAHAIFGRTNGTNSYGVWGSASGNALYGIYGLDEGDTNFGAGVYGESWNGASGMGVQGGAYSAGNKAAIWGDSTVTDAPGVLAQTSKNIALETIGGSTILGGQLRGAVESGASTARPSPASTGQAYFDTDKNTEIHYNGTYWNVPTYGHMYNSNGNETVDIGTADTFTSVSAGFNSGLLDGDVTFEGASALKVDTAGIYKIDWTMSFTKPSSGTHEIEGTVGVDGASAIEATAQNTVTTANEHSSFGSQCILSLSASDELSIMVRNQTAASNVVVEHAALTVQKIR